MEEDNVSVVLYPVCPRICCPSHENYLATIIGMHTDTCETILKILG